MSEKFVCLHYGCDFMSEDEDEAREHVLRHSDHIVASIALDDNEVVCDKLIV